MCLFLKKPITCAVHRHRFNTYPVLMEVEIRKCLRWIQMYERIENAGIVCRKYGISGTKSRKCLNRRYGALGNEGLNDASRRPHSYPCTKVKPEHEVM